MGVDSGMVRFPGQLSGQAISLNGWMLEYQVKMTNFIIRFLYDKCFEIPSDLIYFYQEFTDILP